MHIHRTYWFNFFFWEQWPFFNFEIWRKWKILLKQLVSTTPLKPLNRIAWNFVVMKDIMCSYAFLQEMLIWSFWGAIYVPLFVRLPVTNAWNCHSLYTEFSSNVGAWDMWACSLFLSSQKLVGQSLPKLGMWNVDSFEFFLIYSWLLKPTRTIDHNVTMSMNRLYQHCFLMTRGAWMFVQGHGYIGHILEKLYFYENLFSFLFES